METNQTPNDSEKSAVQLLQEINSGLTDAKLLDVATRQRCIEVLVNEGYTIPHMAQVLRRDEKTVRRDLKTMQARNALSPSVGFAKEFIGQAFLKAMNHHGHLMRIARSKEAKPSEKSQAEFLAWKVLKELIETLQHLGYLPCKPTELVVSHQDSEMSLEEIERTVTEIQGIAKETGTEDLQFRQALEKIQEGLDKSKLAHEAAKLKEQQNLNLEEKENG